MIQKKEKQIIIWFFVYVITFIIVGLYLGVIPFCEIMDNGLMYNFIGLSDRVDLNSIFQLDYLNQYIPYGLRLTEAFGVFFLGRIIGLTGLDPYVTVQIEAFVFFTISYICMLSVMNSISNNRFVGFAVTLVFFWNPVLMAQSGVPPMYFGVLLLPALLFILLRFHQYMKKKIEEETDKICFERKDYCFIFCNFVMFLCEALTSWYLAIIIACAVCLFYLIFYLSYMKSKSIKKLIIFYMAYFIIPWIFALSINLLMTPSSVASTTTAFNFINGSSIDMATMFIPNTKQFIGRFLNIEDVIPENKYIPGNGVAFYFGYSILFLLFVNIILKKNRKRERVALLISGAVLFILSLGPGLRIAAFLDHSMLEVTGQYRLPLEYNVLQFPWGFLFKKFPLNIMRAVCRWYIGAVVLFIVLAAVTLRSLLEGSRKKGKVMAYIICIFMVIEFAPNIKSGIDKKITDFDVYERAYENCVEEISEFFDGKNGKLAFASYDFNDNTYMVPLIMTKLKECQTYSGAGDKSRGMANRYQPRCIYDFVHTIDPEVISTSITKMNAYQLADYAILPYFDLSAAVYGWPPDEGIEKKTKMISRQVAERLGDKYSIIYLDHYMIVELNNEGNEAVDITANKKSENSRWFLFDDGFGTKYAIGTEGVQYTQAIKERDNSLYINCITKSDHQCDTELQLEFYDDKERMIDEEKYIIHETEKYVLTEFQIYIPSTARYVNYRFRNSGESNVYLKKFYAISFDQKAILKSDNEMCVEELTGLSTETVNNIKVNHSDIIFEETSNILFHDSEAEKIDFLNMKMELFIEEIQNKNLEIVNKWVRWQEEMTFALSYHADDQKYYLNISDNGEEAYACSWHITQMPQKQWNSLQICFNRGKLEVYVNERKIVQKKYDFEQLHGSGHPISLGNGMVGKIRNFQYEVQ